MHSGLDAVLVPIALLAVVHNTKSIQLHSYAGRAGCSDTVELLWQAHAKWGCTQHTHSIALKLTALEESVYPTHRELFACRIKTVLGDSPCILHWDSTCVVQSELLGVAETKGHQAKVHSFHVNLPQAASQLL